MNETDVIARTIQVLVPQPCYDKFFLDFDFFNVVCLKVVLSKCLGYSIILGSILVKLPQILKLFKSKSGEGLSLSSLLLELTAVSANSAYAYAKGFPFSSYGEGLFLNIQTSLVVFLVLWYGGKGGQAVAFLAGYGGIMAYLLSPVAPMPLIELIQKINIFIIIASKMLQVIANYRNKSTGQLAFVTFLLIFLGSCSRIFTSIQETGDSVTILQYVIASVCNAMLVAQFFIYAKKESGDVKPKKE